MTKLLFLSFFAVACGSAEKNTSTTESSEPSSEILLYLTQEWSGEWIVTDTSLNGTETYLEGLAETPGEYACYSVWDITGSPGTSCTDCLWEMALTATFNEEESTLNGDCQTKDYEFSYAYTEDYQYNGQSLGEALLYREEGSGSIGFRVFVLPGNPNLPNVSTYTSTISWDETSGAFSYKQGPKDYEYLYTY